MFKSFQDYWGAHKPILDEAFRKQISDLLGNIPLKQTAALRATLEAGKKIRGCLACLISDALGGEPKEVISRAIGIELIQAATLIHDDFVDQDIFCGTRPAAWTLEGARRAVLIGDVFFATAIKMMMDLSIEDGRTVSQAIAQVSKGALHEPMDPLMLAEKIESNLWKGQFYEEIIRLKTGVLFGTACQLGALAAKGEDNLVKISFRYGLHIGEAYQIADDVKEVESHLEKLSLDTGKIVGLAPILLYFIPDFRPNLLTHLREGRSKWEDEEEEWLRIAVNLMKIQIEDRLQEALPEIIRDFPENEYKSALLQTPKDLIRMFFES